MKKQISPYLIVLLIFFILCATAAANMLPPTLEIEGVSFSQVLYAGQSRTLIIIIKNTGPGNAHDLTIKLESDLESLSFAPSTEVPPIPTGSTETVKIPVAGKKDLSNNDEARIRIRLIDKGHNQEFPFDKPRIHKFETRELELVLGQVEFKNVSRQNKSIRRNDVINLKFRMWNKSGITAEAVKVKVDNNQKGVVWIGVELGNELVRVNRGENLPKEHPTFETISSKGRKVINYIYHCDSDFNDHKVRFTISRTTRSGKGNWVKEEYDHPVIIPFNWLHIFRWVVGAVIIVIIIGVAIRKKMKIVPRWISDLFNIRSPSSWLVILGGTVFTIITVAIIIWLGIWKWVVAAGAVIIGIIIMWVLFEVGTAIIIIAVIIIAILMCIFFIIVA